MTGLASRAMLLRYLIATIATGLLFAAGHSAIAGSAAQAASEWGLLGTWALDCSLPPDRDRGARLSYRIAEDGRLILARDFGNASDTNEISDAQIEADGSLRLTVEFPAIHQTRIYRLAKDGDGNIRAISNRDSKGRYSIRNGRFSATGQPTPKQARCG